MKKRRADQLLVEQGLAESREKAQALILAGQVLFGDRPVKKPGDALPEDAKLTVKGSLHPYASRGGLKLERALDHFALSPAGKVALDVGASTGGFTSCLLLRGAKKVYALDVGHNQITWGLRQDPRVVVMEGQNARAMTPALFEDPIELVSCDVSFISLKLILPAISRVAEPGSPAVLLIKPQFEVGPKEVGKGGVVRDPALHERVCREIEAAAKEQGWRVLGIIPSPITGPAGNQEFLLGAIIGEPTPAPKDPPLSTGEEEM